MDEIEAPRIVPYSIRAAQLDDSLLGAIVSFPVHTYDVVAGGALVRIARTGETFVVRVRSQADGQVSRYRLAPSDEVRVYEPVPQVSDQA